MKTTGEHLPGDENPTPSTLQLNAANEDPMRRSLQSAVLGILFLTASVSIGMAQPPIGLSRAPGDFPAGSSPLAVAAGNLSNDRIADLVTANADSNDVSLLIGVGNGTFTDSGMTFKVGLTPVAIAVADVNGDGKPDIITADEIGNTVSVLLNNGNSMFSRAVTSGTGMSPESMFVGDFDHDQILDVATADNVDDTVTILKGVGDGSFTVLDVVPVGAAPVGLAGADLNGDGLLDLVVTNSAGGDDSSGSVIVLKGIAGGRFEPQAEIPVVCATEGCSPVAVAIADFNTDTKLDLAVVNEEGDNVSILLGNGDLTFRVGVTAAVGSFPEDLVVRDFNGDGKLDIATTSNLADNVVVLVGVGDGTFLPQPSTEVAQDAAQDATALVLVDASRFPEMGTVRLGNALVDYVSKVGNTLTLTAPLAQAVTASTAALLSFPVGKGAWGIAAGDFDGDGKPDLATANQDDKTVSILLNIAGSVSSCIGDCEGDGEVTVDSIIKMVNIVLALAPPADCLAGDANMNGEITIDEIIQAVSNTLNGCPLGAAN